MYTTHKVGFVHYLCKYPPIWREIFLPAQSCTLYELILTWRKCKRKSKKQLEKNVQDNRERMSTFLQKKDEERAEKDSLARKQALERLGITQEFNHADHAEIYNYSVFSIFELSVRCSFPCSQTRISPRSRQRCLVMTVPWTTFLCSVLLVSRRGGPTTIT